MTNHPLTVLLKRARKGGEALIMTALEYESHTERFGAFFGTSTPFIQVYLIFRLPVAFRLEGPTACFYRKMIGLHTY
jgi:hypothetical protein